MAAVRKNATKEEGKSAAKTTTRKASAKAEAPKTEEVKTEVPKAEEVNAEAPKPTEKKKPGRKPSVKTAEKKAVEKKPAEKEATAKKELKSEITLQFGGNSYTQEQLVQIAKDVWKYDLAQKESDLVNIELYVKPEEHVAYYKMNEDFTGSFYL